MSPSRLSSGGKAIQTIQYVVWATRRRLLSRMMPDMDVLLHEARQLVAELESGHLPMGYRLRIYDELLELYGAEEGAWRYAALCFFSAAEMLPYWDSVTFDDDLIEVPRQYLKIAICGLLGFEDRGALAIHLRQLPLPCDAESHWMEAVGSVSRGCLAPTASYSAAGVAIGDFGRDVMSYSDSERSMDPDLWDTHAFVAFDWTGDPGHAESHPELLRAYWQKFLAEEVPDVLVDASELRMRIQATQVV